MVWWRLTLIGAMLTGAGPAWAQEQAVRNMSPWGMFLEADALVQAVMIGLFLASVVTWTIWLVKNVEMALVRRRVAVSLTRLAAAPSLDAVCADPHRFDARLAAMVQAAALVVEEGENGSNWPVDDQISARLDRHRIAAGRALVRGTGVLATIGAVAPFVGLFGTVWGIMNSFVGIAQANTTNLAVVAPGIAEALLATGIGLAAAIPAVVACNQLRRAGASVKVLLGDAAVEIRRLAAAEGRAVRCRAAKLAAE